MSDALLTLLTLRKQQERLLAAEAQEAQARLELLRTTHQPHLDALEDAAHLQDAVRQRLDLLPTSPCSLEDAWQREEERQRAEDRLHIARRHAEAARPLLHDAERRAERTLQSWRQARAEAEALERLVEIRQRDASAQLRRRQERELDDLYIQRHAPRSDL